MIVGPGRTACSLHNYCDNNYISVGRYTCAVAARDRITLVGLILETALGLQRRFGPAAEAAIGVGGQAFEICIRLYRSPQQTMRMSDLAVQTGISPSGLTRAVDRLAGEGLVRREHCPEDRRGTYAVLTEEGARRMAAALERHEAEIDRLCALFSAEEEAALGELLERMRNAVNPEAAYLS